jgi:catechol 2,3-dioxygenase-like lactoylglutathione lyase family enzyme
MKDLIDIQYVRFALPDLERERAFLDDFGLVSWLEGDVLYARGTDPKPFVYVAEPAPDGEARFVGLGFEAASASALERLAALDGVPVEASSRPGKGSVVHLTDPDGNAIDVVFGAETPDPLPLPERTTPLNSGRAHARLGERVTLETDRPIVKRLGHAVIEAVDFRRSESWYKERLGLLTSDEIHAGDEGPVLGAFLRMNRGERHVDHHTLFLLGAGKRGFNHAAFEVADWDALMAAHYALHAKGHTHSWGVGKHVLGSQVFDYWKDPHGLVLEHFTDGDLFDEAWGSHEASVQQVLATLWGPAGAPT